MLLRLCFIVLIMVIANINNLINTFLSFWCCIMCIFNRLIKSMLLLMGRFNVITFNFNSSQNLYEFPVNLFPDISAFTVIISDTKNNMNVRMFFLVTVVSKNKTVIRIFFCIVFLTDSSKSSGFTFAETGGEKTIFCVIFIFFTFIIHHMLRIISTIYHVLFSFQNFVTRPYPTAFTHHW